MGFADLKRKEEQEEKKQELYAGGIDERGYVFNCTFQHHAQNRQR